MTNSQTLCFKDLTEGDRFHAHGSLWTKLSLSTARRHGSQSTLLGPSGYGYIGDSICSFNETETVEFVPVQDI